MRRVHLALRQRLRAGEYRPGDQLPTESAFGQEFGVSRITVAKAMAQLVAEGLVSRHRGRGTFATAEAAVGPATARATGKLITFISPGSEGRPLLVRRGIVEGMHEVLNEAGYLVAVDFYTNAEQHLRCLSKYTDPQMAGFALWPLIEPKARAQVSAMLANGFPVVLVDNHLPGIDCDYVVTDNAAGAAAMVEHLKELGHRNISYLTAPPDFSSLSDRLTGFLRGLVLGDLPVGGHSITRIDPLDPAAPARALNTLLDSADPPTALFCANDELAMQIYWLLRERGLSVPHDITLVGYDDIDAAASFAVPLTTVRQNYLEMGQVAARILLERIERRGAKVRYQTQVAPQLKVRESSAAPRSLTPPLSSPSLAR